VSTTSVGTAWPRPLRAAQRITLDREALREVAPLTLLLALTAALYLWGLLALTAGLYLGGLLALTAGLYRWGLSKNGSGNEYHAAAVQAGGEDGL
jgi:hypothetical protein